MLPKSRFSLLIGLSVLAMQPGYGDQPPAQQQKTPDTQLAAGKDSLPAGALVRLGDARFRGDRRVRVLAFTPDGKTLISVDGIFGSGDARFWDIATGRPKLEVVMPQVQAQVALSRDQRFVAWEAKSDVRRGDDDKPHPPESVNVIDIWDLKNGRKLHRLQVPGRPPHSFAFSPDAKMLVSRHTGGVIVLWDCATGRKIKQLQAPGVDNANPSSGAAGSIVWTAWSPTGKRMAIAQRSRPRTGIALPRGTVVRFWAVPEGRLLDETISFEDYCFGLTFSPDGKRLAVHGDQSLLIAEAATGKALRKLSFRGPKSKVAFTADGKLLAATDSRSSGDGETFKQWDDIWLVDLSANEKPRPLPVKPHNITALAFSPDGKTLATSGYDGEIHLWDAATGKEKMERRATALGNYIAFSSDGKTVATGDQSGAIHLWDARTGNATGVLPGKKDVYGLRFSPDSRLLASVGGAREKLCIWDVVERKLLRPYDGERWKEAHLPAFSSDGRTMAVCFGLNYNQDKIDRNTCLYDVISGKEIRRIKTEVDNVAFSPDGKMLAGGCRTDGSGARHDIGVRIWDVASGKLLREPAELREFESWNAESLSFTPDGRNLLVWHRQRFGISHTLAALELASGKIRWEIDVPYNVSIGTVANLALTPDRRIAAVANADTAVALYRLDTVEKLGQLAGHRGAVADMAFAPDGKRLASVSWDKTALIWDTSKFLEKSRPRRVRLSEKEMQSAYDALAGADAKAAHRAIRQLVGAADETTAFLKDRLPRSRESLQQIRAVEVLEYLGSDAARTLLKTLAEGAAESPLTREAKASLRRLGG